MGCIELGAGLDLKEVTEGWESNERQRSSRRITSKTGACTLLYTWRWGQWNLASSVIHRRLLGGYLGES